MADDSRDAGRNGEAPDGGPPRRADDTPAADVRTVNFNTALALFFIVAAIVLWLIIPHQINSRTPAFLLGGFKPELFPRVVALGLGFIGVWYLLASLRMRERNALADLEFSAIRNVAVTLVLAFAYAVALGQKIGFVWPSFAFLFLLSTYLGNRNWWFGIGANLVVVIAIYLVFTKFLLQSLPASPEIDAVYNAVRDLFR